ncbi:MAG: hypothetical protein H8D72_00460 [Planctomycetes bacterium]|nr:hypothetical protein [Planctomycetota bacterium]
MFLLLCLVVAVGGAGMAQEPGGDEGDAAPKVWPKCLECKTTGKLECPDKQHRGLDLSLEVHVRYCSELAGCETCAGIGWIDCDDCERPDVEAELADWHAEYPALKEAADKQDEEMGFPLHTVIGEHMLLVFEIESMKVGRKRLKQHELMHLYIDRLEALYDDYVTSLHVKSGSFRQRSRVFVWWTDKDQKDGSLRFCQQSAGQGVKLLGINPSYSLCGNKRYHKDDESLHRNIVHNVTHLLLSHQSPSDWIGNKKGGWADAGLAHWFEDRYFGLCDNYCYQEQNTNQDFKGGKWKPAVRKMVQLGEAPPVGTVFSRNTDGLLLAEHAVSFSYIDFLMQKDPAMLNLLLRRMRAKTPTRDALAEAFGYTPIQFEEAWMEWVKSTYPLR